ncbi:hypothetical protein [Kitasatospora sp. NPDC001683]
MSAARQQAIAAAGQILAAARAERDALSPEEAAKAAWYPGHELGTVEAIRDLIIEQRVKAAERKLPALSMPAAA